LPLPRSRLVDLNSGTSRRMPQTSPFRHPIGPIARRWRWIHATALQRLGKVPFVVRAQGARFLVDPADYIDRCIAFDGIWEGPQLDILAAVCATRRIDTFLDIGANSGFYSVMFAIENLSRNVIAFEPDPGNFARLRANLDINDLAKRIDAHCLALGDRSGEVTLYEGAPWNRGESTIAEPDQTPKQFTHQVRQVSFDETFSLSGQAIVIKMDVEGYEFSVLAGMERTLGQNECFLQIELYSDRLDELKGVMARRGYRFVHTEYIDHFFTNMSDDIAVPSPSPP
jgi:FkbM family methyltransferase